MVLNIGAEGGSQKHGVPGGIGLCPRLTICPEYVVPSLLLRSDLADVTGPFYTLVLELTVPSLGTFESSAPKLFGDKDWQANYQKMAPARRIGLSGGVYSCRV